jgi:hypothetical protein
MSLLVLTVGLPGDIDAARHPFSSKVARAPTTSRRNGGHRPLSPSLSSSRRWTRRGHFHGTVLPPPPAPETTRPRTILHENIALRGGSTEVGDEETADGHSDNTPNREEGARASSNGRSEMEVPANDENEAGIGNADEETADYESPTINQRVALSIQTNWGSPVLDQKLELEATRNKNIATIKARVSKQLPGKPPALGLNIVYEGRVLEDDVLLDELFQDDDDVEVKSAKTLILSVIPPVDPRFATALIPRVARHSEHDDRTLTTEELLDAYFLNQAAMTLNAELLANPDAASSSSPLLRLQAQQVSEKLKQQLKQETPADVWKKALEPAPKHGEERRGNRYRSGKGRATTSFRRSFQTNLNVVRRCNGTVMLALPFAVTRR